MAVKKEVHTSKIHLKVSASYGGGYVTVEGEYSIESSNPENLNNRVIALAFDGFTQAEELMHEKLQATENNR